MIDFKSMMIPARRFVIIIGNSGAEMSYISDGKIEETWSISDFEPDSLDIISNALDGNRRAPLTVLIDMLEQSYRRESIPPVSMLDRKKVLTRRLGIAFPNHDIKAAIPLDETIGQRGDLSYLFVALPMSPEIEIWIGFLHSLANPISSIGLLPLESSSLAAALSEAQADEDQPPAEWTLMISREGTGGIRQIVVHNGKLAITRLTPPPPGQINPLELAKAISQEMTSTLTYLTRLGYAAGERLDMIVIGPEEMRTIIEAQQAPGRKTTLFTPNQAAALLNLAEIGESPTGFGDPLHIVWAASKRKFALEMVGHVLGQQRVQIEAARKWATGGLAAATIGMIIYFAPLVLDIIEISDKIDDAVITQTRLATLVENLDNQIETYPDRPKLMTAVLAHYDKLTRMSSFPVPVLAGISDSLGPSIRLKSLLWTSEDMRLIKRNQTAPGNRRPEFTVNLAIDLSAFSNGEQALAETNALAERLREQFADGEVIIVRPPLDILPTQTLIGFATNKPVEVRETEALSADISILVKPE